MKRKHVLLILLVTVFLFSGIPAASADSEEATDLTKQFTFDFGSYERAKYLLFTDIERAQAFDADASFAVTWSDAVPDARLCIQFRTLPEDVSVLQYDASDRLLAEDPLPGCPGAIVPLMSEARKAVIQSGTNGMNVSLLGIFGPGELPDPFHDWQATPAYLDYLLISTHPDDDVLYLGSIVPVYGAEQGYTGTIAYVTNPSRNRMMEAENGAWAMGLRVQPLFWMFPDVPRNAPQEKKDTFVYEDVLLETVRTYRIYHPLVVFAQDENGEYGHWQHIISSKAAREAFTLAADPSYDPESAERYGTWQVQKLFLHLYESDPLTVDGDAPLTFFDGKSAFDVAKAAFKKHKSQLLYGYEVTRNDELYAFNRFGMAEGVVPLGKDVFDNIDETLLSTYVPPAETPTPEPTEVPTPVPTPQTTPSPSASAAPVPEPVQPSTHSPLLWVGPGVLIVVLIGVVIGIVCRKNARS